MILKHRGPVQSTIGIERKTWRREISFTHSNVALPSLSHRLILSRRGYRDVLSISLFFSFSLLMETLSEHWEHCFSRWSKGTVHQVNPIVSFTSISTRVFQKFGICIILPLIPWISSFSFVSFYLHPLYVPLPRHLRCTLLLVESS